MPLYHSAETILAFTNSYTLPTDTKNDLHIFEFTWVRMFVGSAPKFSNTRAATPSPSRNKPRSKCSVPM